jgi:cyclopropane fatty-acyl-phospholipid synthase-like methyltransferase
VLQSETHPATGREPLRERITNLYWETRLGIATRGLVGNDNPDSLHYATVNYSTLWRILDHLALQPDDTFVDIGCGKGRILCCAARYRCNQVVGVDLSEQLCQIARANAARLHGRKTPVEVHHGYAQEFDYRDATACYLFHPFGATTLDLVLNKIRTDRDGRAVRIAFQNPDAAHAAVFAKHDWLQPYTRWEPTTHHTQHVVTFHRSG